MSDHLRLPFNQPVCVRFLAAPWQSRVVHWMRSETKWNALPCAGVNCSFCLIASRVQQRFTAEVVSGGERATLDLPIGAWRLIAPMREQMGDGVFFATNFHITRWRHSTLMTVDFELTVAP